MFYNASAFNQPLNNWDVSSVIDMTSMFRGSAFNHTISCWDIKTVNVETAFTSSPAADSVHYIQYDGFAPTNTGATTLGAKDSADSDCACPPGSYKLRFYMYLPSDWNGVYGGE